MNSTIDNRKARGLCIECGEVPAMRGKTRCYPCSRRWANYQKSRSLRKRANKPTREGNLGRVQLARRDVKELRWQVFERSQGQCEAIWDGERCKKTFGWSNFRLHHVQFRSQCGSDTPENCIAICFDCDKRFHPGPQWTKKSEAA